MSRRSTILLVVLALLILSAGHAHGPRLNVSSLLSQARAELVQALGPCRFTAGRLTGGFAYAPFDPSHQSPRTSRELRAALRDVLDQASGSSPQELAARALVELIAGKPRQAVADLEKAIALEPANAAFLSDLAAAYLEEARADGNPLSLVKALESAEKAVVINPALHEARFNRALALGSLFLTQQERLAWKNYLQLASHSPWAAEARTHLRALNGTDPVKRWTAAKLALQAAALRGDRPAVHRIVDGYPQAARELAEEELLGDWADAWSQGRKEEANRALALARGIGEALSESGGDRMLSASVAAIDAAAAETESPGRLLLLVEGHRRYREGSLFYAEGRLAEAEDRFERAGGLLQRARSPFAGWGTFRVAVCEMQHFQYERALALLGGLRSTEAARLYKSLAGRAHWVAGLVEGIAARPTESLAAYREAWRLFDAAGESENRGVVSALIAEALRLSGDLAGAWRYQLSALRSLGEMREPDRRALVLEGGGLTALETGQPLAALALQQEIAASLGNGGPPAAWIYFLRRRASLEMRAGRTGEARRDLAAARRRLEEVADEGVRNSLLGDILAVEGQEDDRGDSGRAVASLSEVIGIYRDTRYQQQLALFLARRARAQATLGRLDLAEADYAEAIRAIARQREATAERDLRGWFLARSRSIFEEMVQLQARRGKPGSALSYAESGRVQLFREQAQAGAGRPAALSSAEISREMPPGVALVEFFVAGRQLLAWVVQRDSLRLFATGIDPGALARRIARFRRGILSGNRAEAEGDSRALYALLIAPIERALEGAGTLVLVPDGALYSLPFAALQAPDGRYLVETYALAVDPSASLYVQVLAREKSRARGPLRSVLSLGEPALDRGLLPELASLPQSREEAARVAGLYPRAELRVGAEATKRRFLEGLAEFDVIHFTGHAVADSRTPAASFLALAPSASGEDSGLLYARELYGRPAPVTRLVVLSACATALGDARAGEGLAGLARPFLASGVPAVVASLWQIDDRSSAALLEAFHRRVLAGLGAAEALREAQMEMQAGRDPFLSSAAAWAGFQVLGAGT
jgi:CHAT domain-containing protein